jgi:hypothetical protein
VTRSIRILIAVALAAGAGFGYWHVLLAPKRAEANRLATKQQTAQAQIAQAQATLDTYKKAQSAYAANYTDVVRLGKAVPADDDVRSLMLQLDTSASRSGVDFSDFQLSSTSSSSATPNAAAAAATAKLPPGAVEVGSAGFAELPFQFAFQGTYDGLESFFDRLERMVAVKDQHVDVSGRLLRVESIAIAPHGDGFPNLEATITAASYVAPAQDGLKAPGSAAATASASASAATTSTTPTTGVAG